MSMASEAERVDGWRAKRFFRMGFDESQVALLIRWGTSPGTVEPLIEHGCPPALALRIMRPLDDRVVIPLLDQADQYSVKV